ncbi:class A beta-lactamase [Halodurantibacterium flavum]|uniref:Beta-lactamase n=1 Tax=Halodurantibacterium flavum TaxID=1382802 RepID=A0ABW4RZU2_9RHOB
MPFTTSALSRAAAGLALGLSLASHALAETPLQHLAATVAEIEDRFDARVGLVLTNSGTGESWAHRADERFLMTSTAKVPLCGAVLARVDEGALSLSEALPVTDADILSYAPVTETRVGDSMTIADLCLAAIDMSDNTAANLLIDRLGGPQAVTQFLRDSGDPVSRLDRREPELNTFAPGDERDTSTPAAMADTLRNLLLGDVLTPASREQLADWMARGGVTGAFLRRDAPGDWIIHDKSGGGDQTRSIVALITPADGAPWVATIFLSDADVDFATRNAALQELSAAVIAVIRG